MRRASVWVVIAGFVCLALAALAQTPSGAVPTSAGHVKAPVLVKESGVKLSREEKRLHSSGATEVRTVISAKGIPEDVTVIRSCGQPALDQRVVEAVERYRFKPGTKDGVPARIEFYIDVSFAP